MKRLLLPLLLLFSCRSVPSATGPMERVEFPFRPGRKVDRLIVMVHGRGDTLEIFEKRGFMKELAARAMPMDVVAVDAHAGYFKARNFAERFHDDVILPKRQEGYREIYVLGVSLGGLGALSFARRYAGEPDGLILFAPYLGERALSQEIEAAGGLLEWAPNPPLEDVEPIWVWLKGYAESADRPPLELMWGSRDRFAPQMNVLKVVLQDHRAHAQAGGGHDWKTWRSLWSAFLDRDPFGWAPEIERLVP